MGGRPEEDEQEKQDGEQRDIAGRRGPADQRWERAGGTTDDDVLRGAALQPYGVDQHVEQDRDGQDRGGDRVYRESHEQDRECS